ncbi:hypothetical protein ILUMI_24049 [Ignelater luminosus]|uniref:Alpha-galactosidase n=1 Tax=Ignelater luminosus TaxID=2038154 RepID=A0A8K0CDD1_IGNLU|nr:hypothetical protein ILUMI_24049 [Ignelater luminosus]
MKMLGIFLVASVSLVLVNGLENGLARTPPMGWMHWERFRCIIDCDLYPDDCVSEQLFRKMADLLVSEGYLAAGYEYIIVDDCWMSKHRDKEGRLQSDPIRFPSGIKALADYVHSKGLKFGLYEDYGNYTCKGYPGILGHLETDAKTFAEWDVDYVKLDGCYSDYNKLEEGYAEFGRLLNKTGRPMVYSCSWPAYQEPLGIHVSKDTWSNVTNILRWFSKNQNRIAAYAGPGHWNDPDMLIIGNYALSYEQSKAQMAIWAILAAPLIMSNDLRNIEPKFKEILLNKDIIAINQDPLGIQGLLVKTVKNIDIWIKPILPFTEGSYSYAVAFISNRVDGYAYRISVPLKDVGLNHTKGYRVEVSIYSPFTAYRSVKVL